MLIEKLAKSPHCQAHPAALDEVTLGDGFLGRRCEINRRASIPHGLKMLEEVGNFEAYEIAQGKQQSEARGFWFRDSDVYKWLEAAALALATQPDEKLRAECEQVIDLVERTQEPDGYVNTGYTCRGIEHFTDLAMGHEIYIFGHMIEAGIAYRRATGDERFFNMARKTADLMCATFGPDRKPGAPGHPEVEVALVELYRETGEQKYLDLARYFIDARGSQPALAGGKAYMQDHKPVREEHSAVGHAVRALYLYAGITDLALEAGDADLRELVSDLWEDIERGKMYVHGGVGARHDGEAFGDPYELPTDTAYCETCAAIADIRWNRRMFALDPQSKYFDRIERALYNAMLSGVGLDGVSFFYTNPLEVRDGRQRGPWHSCACCPPNVMRTLGHVPSYVFATGERDLYVNLYHNAKFSGKTRDGTAVACEMKTTYPWSGTVQLTVTESAKFGLHLRVPAWAAAATVKVNGAPEERVPVPGTFATLRRTWAAGDVVELELKMVPRWVRSDSRVAATRGMAALGCGPLIYCFEGIDNPKVSLAGAAVRAGEVPQPHVTGEFAALGDVTALRLAGTGTAPPAAEAPLYLAAPAPRRDVELTAIPYCLWANRGPAEMIIWLPAVE